MHSKHLPIWRRLVVILLILLFTTSCSAPAVQQAGTRQIRIHDIQSCAHLSPYTGKFVEDISGIVTWKTSKGFYLQDDHPDKDDCSSEAVYVFTNSYTEVLPGDLVTVSGIVEEFTPGSIKDHNLTITEITYPKIQSISHGHQLPEAVVIGDHGRTIPDRVIDDDGLSKFDIYNDGIDFYESLESMLVQVSEGVVVGPRNSYNEVVIIPPGLITENILSPAGSLLQRENDLNPERIILNLNDSNVDAVNVGSQLMHSVQGVLDYSYGNYKVNTFGKVEFSDNPTSISTIYPDVSRLSIASYNTENLSRFDTDARFNKIADIVANKLGSPEIVILHEVMDDSGIEDDGTVTAKTTIQKIIDSILSTNRPLYDFIQVDPDNGSEGGIPGGNIRSVILFRTDTGVKLLKDALANRTYPAALRIGENSPCFNGARKPVAAVFMKNNKKVLVIGTHLTSLGADSPIFGILQPISRPEEDKRVCQAETIRRFVDDFVENNPDARVIVAGDMNDYPWSKTINTLTASNLTNLSAMIPENERFSYILDGNAVQLDYIMTNNAVDNQDRFIILHLNSILDHTLRSSDHDPVFALIGVE